jgi:hypothetical protein
MSEDQTAEPLVRLDCGHVVPADQIAAHVAVCPYYDRDTADPSDVPWGG